MIPFLHCTSLFHNVFKIVVVTTWTHYISVFT